MGNIYIRTHIRRKRGRATVVKPHIRHSPSKQSSGQYKWRAASTKEDKQKILKLWKTGIMSGEDISNSLNLYANSVQDVIDKYEERE